LVKDRQVLMMVVVLVGADAKALFTACQHLQKSCY